MNEYENTSARVKFSWKTQRLEDRMLRISTLPKYGWVQTFFEAPNRRFLRCGRHSGVRSSKLQIRVTIFGVFLTTRFGETDI